MTKAKTYRNYRSYVVPGLLFIFGLFVSFTLISSTALSGAYITPLDILLPILALLSTLGLGLLCYTGLRSGKKLRELPKVVLWIGWASMIVMILGVLEVILIVLMTSPVFMSQ